MKLISNKILTKKTSRHNQSGSALVEYAITISFLSIIIFLGLNLLVSSYHALTIQFVANRALRTAVIGPPNPLPTGYNHTNAIRDYIISYAGRLGISLDNTEISICPISNTNCYPNINSGNPNEWIIIRINLNERIFNKFNFASTAIAIGRNEPT